MSSPDSRATRAAAPPPGPLMLHDGTGCATASRASKTAACDLRRAFSAWISSSLRLSVTCDTALGVILEAGRLGGRRERCGREGAARRGLERNAREETSSVTDPNGLPPERDPCGKDVFEGNWPRCGTAVAARASGASGASAEEGRRG